MKKQVYEIDENCFIKEIYVKDFDNEGNPLEVLAENIITINPPNGLYRAKWTGEEWIEGLTEQELEAIEYEQYLESLKPSEEEIKNAQLELVILNLLIDMEVM